MTNVVTKTIDLGDGKAISLETGKLAKLADGSVVLRLGDTMLLASVVAAKEAGDDIDFLPLTVEYKEKFASAGKIPGGFFKREARPTEDEILICRLIDRALRPLFPDDFHASTQIVVNLISSDKVHSPDALACLAASAALCVSDIPFAGPVSEVRVSRINGKFVINPTIEENLEADMDLIVAGTEDNIMMVEGEMSEVSEAEMVEAINVAHAAIKVHCKAQLDFASQVEKSKVKREYEHERHDEDLKKAIHEFAFDKFKEFAREASSKEVRAEKFSDVKEAFIETMDEEEVKEKAFLIGQYFGKVKKEAVRDVMLNEGKRLDGRKHDEVRNIWSEVDYLPGTHGSALFTRGETQSLTTLTLGSKMDEQRIDGALIEETRKFMLHYNFPAFSVGDSRPNRGTSRREIGHGNLALRALKPVLPVAPENPYTVRLVSDILESNGSSSMATVCAGCLALMDGGIQIKAPVSGIAMGLVMDPETKKYMILSDILGDEDHLGDMDFKITGTANGITACQMDIKVDGLSSELLMEALTQAKVGREHILNEMLKTLDAPRTDYKPHAPRIESFDIPKEMIGPVIGPGGKIIQEIQEVTGATIVLEEIDGKGRVDIISEDKEALENAMARVKAIAFPPTPEVGAVYDGKVKSIMPYGAFVEIMPGVDGLLHVSEIAHKRVENVADHFKEGDMVEVKLVGIEERSGKLKLSRKVLLEKENAPA
ncbi:MAG: polyribonucleotide nucleotidyltransferase [Flavobacteriales bacterium]|nr:polyribonucleotide nucleotidyltransferase [Flavobacteriales bacterium]